MQTEMTVLDSREMRFAEICETFNRIFEGYLVPLRQSVEDFGRYVRQANLDLAQTVVLRDSDGRLVGAAFLAIRADRAWCGGFGVTPEFRKQGWGTRLAEEMVTRARKLNLKTLQLEVLAQNEGAIRCYQKVGLEKVRNLFTLENEVEAVLAQLSPETEAYRFVEVSVAEAFGLAEVWKLNAAHRPVWSREASSLLTAQRGTGWLAYSSPVAGSEGQAMQKPEAVFVTRSGTNGSFSVAMCATSNPQAIPPLLHHVASQWFQRRPPDEEEESVAPKISLHDEPEDTALYALARSLNFRQIHHQEERLLVLRSED